MKEFNDIDEVRHAMRAGYAFLDSDALEVVEAAKKAQQLELQIDLLKKALYAECTGQACNPDDCYQGYRQCTGCEIRAKKAYGEGWGK